MDIKELVRTGMFSVGCLMCHTKKVEWFIIMMFMLVTHGQQCRLLLNCLNCI